MPDLTVLLGCISTGFLTLIIVRWILVCVKRWHVKGPYGFPILGHLPLFGKHPPTTFMRWWKSYGDVFNIRMGSWNVVVVNGYSAVKTAAEHPGDAFSGRPPFLFMELVNNGDNESPIAFGYFSPVYMKQRKHASKALRLFTSKRHMEIEDLVVTEAEHFVDDLVKKFGTYPGSIQIDVETFVVRISYQTLYGRGDHAYIDQYVNKIMTLEHEINKCLDSGSIIDVLPWLQYILPWRVEKMKAMISKMKGVNTNEVHEHYKTFSRDNIRDVADALLASEASIEDDVDRYEMTQPRLSITLGDLLGASADTTHITIIWLLLYMCAYPDIQRKVHEEIDEIVGGSRRVNLSDRENLVYTEAVIHEVLRFITPVPFAVPHYALKDGDIQGTHVEKGTVVIFNLYSINHEEQFWGDPANFRPERFILDDNTLDKEKVIRVTAFGFGRRRCIGDVLAKINLFLTFATTMQKCKMVKPPEETLDLSPVPGLVYSAKESKVRVTLRS